MRFLGKHYFPGEIDVNIERVQEISVSERLNIPTRPPLDLTVGDLYSILGSVFFVNDHTVQERIPDINDIEHLFPLIISQETLYRYFNFGNINHIESLKEASLGDLYAVQYDGTCLVSQDITSIFDFTIFPEDSSSFVFSILEYRGIHLPAELEIDSTIHKVFLIIESAISPSGSDTTISARVLSDLLFPDEIQDSTRLRIDTQVLILTSDQGILWTGPPHKHSWQDIDDLTNNFLQIIDGTVSRGEDWELVNPIISVGIWKRDLSSFGDFWSPLLFWVDPFDATIDIYSVGDETSFVYSHAEITIPFSIKNRIKDWKTSLNGEHKILTNRYRLFILESITITPGSITNLVETFLIQPDTTPVITEDYQKIPYCSREILISQPGPGDPITIDKNDATYVNLVDGSMAIYMVLDQTIPDGASITLSLVEGSRILVRQGSISIEAISPVGSFDLGSGISTSVRVPGGIIKITANGNSEIRVLKGCS